MTRRQQVTPFHVRTKNARPCYCTAVRSCKRPVPWYRSFHFWRAGFGVRSKYVTFTFTFIRHLGKTLPQWSVFKSHLDYVVSATLRLKKGQANCTARVGPIKCVLACMRATCWPQCHPNGHDGMASSKQASNSTRLRVFRYLCCFDYLACLNGLGVHVSHICISLRFDEHEEVLRSLAHFFLTSSHLTCIPHVS